VQRKGILWIKVSNLIAGIYWGKKKMSSKSSLRLMQDHGRGNLNGVGNTGLKVKQGITSKDSSVGMLIHRPGAIK
jgi:hypothetical protein